MRMLVLFFLRFIVLLLFSCFENATVFPMGSQRFSDLLFSRFPRIQWPRKSQDVLCHGNNKSPKSETPKRNFFLFLSCFGFVVFWCEDTKNWCSSSEKQSWQDPYSAGIIKEKAEIAAGHSGWQAAAGCVKNGRQARMTPCACCGISALRGLAPSRSRQCQCVCLRVAAVFVRSNIVIRPSKKCWGERESKIWGSEMPSQWLEKRGRRVVKGADYCTSLFLLGVSTRCNRKKCASIRISLWTEQQENRQGA